MRTRVVFATCLALFAAMLNQATPARAEDKRFDLALPEALAATGLPQYLLPRFALKYGIRITPTGAGQSPVAEITDGKVPGAVAVFAGDGVTYYLRHDSADADAARFADWLASDVGRRTVDAFPGPPAFTAEIVVKVEPVALQRDGVAAEGERQSLRKCGRCHVVSDANRMNGIGSTPSFSVLRALADWSDRFETFYVRQPHPSFTQIAEVTAPFSDQLPPPIHPIELTLGDLENILAFVAGLAPADLGAPIQHQ